MDIPYPDLYAAYLAAMRDVTVFSSNVSGVRLRAYQRQVARAIVDSVLRRKGLTFVVIFPRQSGKNELQAEIEAYLLTFFQYHDAEIIKVSPTWKPQSLNAMRRLERIVGRNLITRDHWTKEQGYIYRIRNSRIFFLSGEPTANIVGATASTLLECDEAQDVLPSKWDKDVNPMAASTNATRVFWGTAWTSQTLLAREKRAALEAQKRDGIQRVFELTADQVRREVPAYGRFVDGEIAKLGRNHPFVRTQFFSEEIDEQAGLFTAERLALMQGDHPAAVTPESGVAGSPGAIYAFCIDVGGELVGAGLVGAGLSEPCTSASGNPPSAAGRHDSTVLTIFEIDLSTLADAGLRAPTFRTVHRRKWTGAGQPQLYAELNALANLWCPHRIVIDATGLGEGLAAFLEKSHPGRVIRFKFSQSSKSDLGWRFLAIVESGRYKEHARAVAAIGPVAAIDDGGPAPAANPPSSGAALQHEFFRQARHTSMEILPGPGRILRYSVPDGTRDPETGELLHDDLVLSSMLCAALYEETWGETKSAVIPASDPLRSLTF